MVKFCVDLRDLLQELKEVAAYWFTVGLYLIEYYELEIISENHRGQCIKCLTEMLVTWLKGTDASSAALVQALRSAGMVQLAKRLAVKYGEKKLI